MYRQNLPNSLSHRRARVWVVTLLFGLGLAGAMNGRVAAATHPNIVLIIADDMAWNDCGAYGHETIHTPNLDRLAAGGMRFDQAFLTCSSCSPSRSSIITGRYPHNTGASQLHQPLPGEQVTFVEKLGAAGYHTMAVGKWHLGPATVPKFNHIERKVEEWQPVLRQRPTDQPFFLWLAFVDPHRPYQDKTVEKRHAAEDAVVPPFLPDVPAVRNDLADYYDEIARLDSVVGQLMGELEAQDVLSNTLIVFISDNGRPFPRCKTTVYDSGIKTPFLVRWDDHVPAGSSTSSLASSLDLAPTFLDVAGVDPPESFQGVSLLPLFSDPAATVREEVFAEHNWHDFEDFGRAVRTQQFKYIRNVYTDVPGTPPADAVRSPTFQTMIELKEKSELTPAQLNPFVVPRPAEELYDVENDPYELTNLAGDPEYRETLEGLRHRLEEWMDATDDEIPEQRLRDEFDRTTGERLSQKKNK